MVRKDFQVEEELSKILDIVNLMCSKMGIEELATHIDESEDNSGADE